MQYFLAKYIMNLPDLAFGSESWIVFQCPSPGKQAGANIFVSQMQEFVCLRLRAQESVTGGKFGTEQLLVPGSAFSSQQNAILRENLWKYVHKL